MEFSCRFVFSSVDQSDVVVLSAAVVEHWALVGFEESFSADVVGGDVFVEDREFKLGVGVGLDGDWKGLIPSYGFVLLPRNYLGFELRSTAGPAADFYFYVVLHFANDIVVLVKFGIANGDFDSWHI